MRISKEYKIEVATLKDTVQPVLNNVNIQTWNRGKPQTVAIAANGFIAVVVPVELDESDTLGMFQASILKEARKAQPRHLGEPKVQLGETTLTLENGHTFPRDTEGTFPDLERITPNVVDQQEVTNTFAFNAAQIKALSDALGSVYLYFRRLSNSGPVLVKPSQCTDEEWPQAPFGLLMPLIDATKIATR